MHQISAGSERAIVAHWINNHCSLVHVPHVREAPQQCHCAPLSQVSTRSSYQASCFAPIPGWQPCLALPSTALPWAEIALVVSWAASCIFPLWHVPVPYLGPRVHIQVPRTCQVMCLYLLKHLFHTVLGQVSIPAQNNANGYTF